MTDLSRFGVIAIIGESNVGKSTLVNKLVGQKISIVTHKVQTTRNRVLGILQDKSQIVLVDTPGIFKPKKRFDSALIDAAWSGLFDSDIGILLLDARYGFNQDTKRIVSILKENKRKVICVINKIDLVSKNTLLMKIQELKKCSIFSDYFLISALNGDGLGRLLNILASRVPLGPWHYPKDQVADMPMRSFSLELVREKLLLYLHQELPYELTLEMQGWEEIDDGSCRIDIAILVKRENHKPIVLGKNGSKIKRIGSLARQELKRTLEREVHLFLYVKVNEKWQDTPQYYSNLGLTFPKGGY